MLKKTFAADLLILSTIVLLFIHYFPLSLLLNPSQTVGGDTTAHVYYGWLLATHCLPKGEVLCWSNDLLMGYPVFQYYFPFPFLISAALSHVIAFHVAFKLVVFICIISIPFAMYTFSRLVGIDFPGPALAAVFSCGLMFAPFNYHSGFYVLDNLSGQFSSTFAISLYFVFLGLLYRMLEKGTGVVHSGFWLGIASLSHTMLVPLIAVLQSFAAACISRNRRKALRNVLFSLTIGFSFVAFWAVPFLFDTDFSVSPRINKTIDFTFYAKYCDMLVILLHLVAVIGAFFLFRRKDPRFRFVLLLVLTSGVLLATSLFANYFATLPVLDRFLPIYLLLIASLASFVFSAMLRDASIEWRKLACFFLAAAVYGNIVKTTQKQPTIPQWAGSNFSGLEAKLNYRPYKEFIRRVSAVSKPGRVSTMMLYDSPTTAGLGGPFIWDILPMFTNHPGLATGTQGFYSLSFAVVNAYFYSGISSGDPTKLSLLSELLNVDYVLKSLHSQNNILEDVFQLIGEIPTNSSDAFQIYERKEKRWNYISIPDYTPLRYAGELGKRDAVEEQLKKKERSVVPLVFSKGFPGEETKDIDTLPLQPVANSNCKIEEQLSNERVTFSTTCPNLPHIVRISYHPGWHAATGESIYQVSPNFMLLYPNSSKVELRYGRTIFGKIGQAGTVMSLLVIVGSCFVSGVSRLRR